MCDVIVGGVEGDTLVVGVDSVEVDDGVLILTDALDKVVAVFGAGMWSSAITGKAELVRMETCSH